MRQVIFKIRENELIAKNTYKAVLEGDVSDITAPGMFVNLKIDGFFLRRPISVCDVGENSLTIIYKVVGNGTKKTASLPRGTEVDVLTALGNGYTTTTCGSRPVLIGGGAGVPPMYYLAKKLTENGIVPTAILGFNSSDEVFFKKEFTSLGVKTIITTVDGSEGIKGFVTDALKTIDYSYFYACGPEAMLHAVYDISKTSGQLSFEERMGCGFGACMGCSCETLYGTKRICTDGPVLEKEEIIWEK